jgi:hypothetical protein
VAYSLLRHIGRAVFFSRFSADLPVAMFTAYFDASGTKRTQVLTVAGFVSHVKRWERFDQKWSAILRRNNVGSFHMTDFASSEGEFKSWRGKSELRRTFIADLVECVRQETKRGFAASVIVSEYEEVNRDYELSERAGTPYVMCATACLGGLNRWVGKRDLSRSHALVVVEDGDEDQGEFVNRARFYGYKAIRSPKSEVQAFQAGDLVAWKCRTMISNALENAPIAAIGDEEKVVRSLDPIRGIVHDNGAHDKNFLLAFCAAAKIPRRRDRITA